MGNLITTCNPISQEFAFRLLDEHEIYDPMPDNLETGWIFFLETGTVHIIELPDSHILAIYPLFPTFPYDDYMRFYLCTNATPSEE